MIAVERSAVVAEARSWLGTPWHHAARIKGAGVDCGQFIAGVFEACGLIPHVTTESYPADWALHRGEPRFQRTVETYAVKVEREPLPGDILLYQYGRCLSHAAIVVDWPLVVHAYLGTGTVTLDDSLKNADLARRLAGVWSLKRWEA